MHTEIIEARNAYAYPPIGLGAHKNLINPSEWETAYRKNAFKTTLELDMHHYYHLRSKDDQEVLLGIYSVMYWGYITSGAKSTTRCEWLSVGNSNYPATSLSHIGIDAAVSIVEESTNAIDNKNYSTALSIITKLPHVGVSFGTKFLAFLDLENAGILDNKITEHFAENSYSNFFDEGTLQSLRKPNNESDVKAGARYEAFCTALNIIKSEMNSKKKYWKDVSGAEMLRFRAVDIERALFAIAKANDADDS